MCLFNFWTFCPHCERVLQTDWFFARHTHTHTQQRSDSIRRMNSFFFFFFFCCYTCSRESWLLLCSIDKTFGHFGGCVFHLLCRIEVEHSVQHMVFVVARLLLLLLILSFSLSVRFHRFIAIHFPMVRYIVHDSLHHQRNQWVNMNTYRTCAQRNTHLVWHCVGDGGTRTNLRSKICCKLNQLMSFVCLCSSIGRWQCMGCVPCAYHPSVLASHPTTTSNGLLYWK